MSVTWSVTAHTQGARWTLVDGMPSRQAAAQALTVIIARDGLRAADGSGRMVPVTMTVDEGPS